MAFGNSAYIAIFMRPQCSDRWVIKTNKEIFGTVQCHDYDCIKAITE